MFRRTQTRQILAFERELEPGRYLTDLQAILSDARVRPHIRETIVRWLATVADPTLGEWELVARYAACDGLPRTAGNGLFERRTWSGVLRTQGVLAAWLANADTDPPWA